MKRMLNAFILTSLIQASAYALLPAKIAYYGDAFTAAEANNDIAAARMNNDDLKSILHKILTSGHIKTDQTDELVSSCNNEKNCEQHTAYGYDRARKFLFGNFYLVQLSNSSYGIKEMYCDRVYQNDDFHKGNQPGENIIPDSTIINVEHTWPQSKFTKLYPKELQKSDLHHLFPTDSVMNSLRGNNIFGEVEHDERSIKCGASRYGSGSAGTTRIFEPPDDHKGHVARALFYFSVRYDMPITEDEEVILKKWHREHPVDQEEMNRNDEIQKVQYNRNPFIDYPELVDQISNF